jgi:hypothetical protein
MWDIALVFKGSGHGTGDWERVRSTIGWSLVFLMDGLSRAC